MIIFCLNICDIYEKSPQHHTHTTLMQSYLIKLANIDPSTLVLTTTQM